MKKILVVAALLAGATMAQTAPSFGGDRDTTHPSMGDMAGKIDSLRKLDSARHHEFEGVRDSGRLCNRIPDSLRPKIEARINDFRDHKAAFDSAKSIDTAKRAEFKLKADSLRKIWEVKRDSQITNIKDTAVQAKVRARVAEIKAQKEAVKAKVEARKAELEAKRAELKAKAKPEAPAEGTTTTP